MPRYSVNDVIVDFYSIGQVASAIGKKYQAIRKWESSGRIPKATYRAPSGYRIYTKGQLDLIVDTFKKYPVRIGYQFPVEFTKILFEKWDEKALEFD